MVVKSLEIEPIKYNCSIGHFRAFMDKFLSISNGIFSYAPNSFDYSKLKIDKSSDIVSFAPLYRHLKIQYFLAGQNSTREVWYVFSLVPSDGMKTPPITKFATILAIEEHPGETTVKFMDGTRFQFDLRNSTIDFARYEFIGDDFMRLVEFIKAEWEKMEEKPIENKSATISHSLKKIKPIEYAGSVAHFRARMDRFLAVNGKFFKVKNDTHTLEYQIEYFTPAQTTTREVWNVLLDPRIVIDGKSPGKSRFGMILATEDQPDNTIIEFLDGRCYQRTSPPTPRASSAPPILGAAYLAFHEPLGDDFIKISEWIKQELDKDQMPLKFPQEPNTNNLTDWFDYRHSEGHGRITLLYIAQKTNYEYSTVRKEHSNYKKRNEIPSRRKKVTKSNKK